MSKKNEIDLIRSNIECIKKFCLNDGQHADEKLIVQCDELLDCSQRVHTKKNDLIGKKVFFEEIPCNGYVIFLRTILAFTNQIVVQIRDRNRLDQNLIKIFAALFIYRDWMFEIDAILDKESENSERRMLVDDLSFTTKAFYNAFNMDKNVTRILFSTAASFWLDDSTRRIIKFLILQVALLTRPPCSFSSIFSSADMGRFYLKAVKNCDLDYPFSVWNRVEGWFVTKFMNNMIINRKVPVTSSTIQIPKQTRFILNSKGDIFDFDRMSEQEKADYKSDQDEQNRLNAPGRGHRNHETIKCRYSRIISDQKVRESMQRVRSKRKCPKTKYDLLKYYTARKNSDLSTNEQNNNLSSLTDANLGSIQEFTYTYANFDSNFDSNPTKTLMIYIHGGGFFAGGSTSCELFLRAICDDLAGIPILAIDYSLTVPYPIPNQECMDVYLWLFSGRDDVKEMLGFHPQRIVVSGDSAGGFLTISLITILNELNKLTSDTKIPLPISIVTAYPVYSVLICWQTLLEPLVEPHLLLLIHGYYGANVHSNNDFEKIKNTQRYRSIMEKNKDVNSDGVINEFSSKKNMKENSPWFRCDYPTYKNRNDYINSFFDHPFIAPKLYAPKYDELKEISLFVFAGDQDMTIDDCTELAKRWKGKVCFDSFENIIHGFLTFAPFDKLNTEALQFVTSRFQEACGLF